jgi:hypothetical protein
MATVTRGVTFGVTEQVTNTKLHNLLDLATVTSIVNADVSASAAIVDTKLAQITTASKVSGTALTGLANIVSGAGKIPLDNLPGGTGANNLLLLSVANTLPALSASALTELNGSNISSGTVAVARLGSGSPSATTYLRGDGAWTIAPENGYYTAGNTFTILSMPTAREGSESTYTKVKEGYLLRGGTLRISFDLGNDTGSIVAYGRIYRNGVAVGTERTHNDNSYETFTEDISGWSAGDQVQLYCKRDTSDKYKVCNFTVKVANCYDNTVLTD